MRRAVEKLKSRSGASFSIALLLFLVCTVVGSVLLAAATTAAGRMSRMAEMDRRYYRVSSAASLLAEELSGEEKKVTVERSKTTVKTVTQHYTVTENQVLVSEEVRDPETELVLQEAVYATQTKTTPGTVTTTYTGEYQTTVAGTEQNKVTVNSGGALPTSTTGVKVATDDLSLLTRCAVELMFGGSNCNTDDAMNYSFSEGRVQSTGSLPLTPANAPEGAGSLAVSASYAVQTDGTLVFTVWDGETPTDRYQLTVTLEPHAAETKSNTSSTSGPTVEHYIAPQLDSTPGGFDQVTATTTRVTKNASVYWTVKSIQ